MIDKDTKCFRVKFADLLSHSDHNNPEMCFGPFLHIFTLYSTIQNISAEILQCRALLILRIAFDALSLYNIAEAKNLCLI